MAKTFLCIGVGPGIGLATSLKFALEGFKPILVARNLASLQKLAKEIKEKSGQDAAVEVMDAGDSTQMLELSLRYPHVDVLHYNAAIIHAQTIAQATYKNIFEDIHVGITGALYALKAFSLPMLARQSGTFLLTGGMLALRPVPEYLALGIAKAGIRNMTEALFVEYAKNNVHIATVTVSTAVAPYSPEAAQVADIFWQINCQAKENWTWNEDYPK